MSTLLRKSHRKHFFKALKSLNKFDGTCEVKVWLCQIAKNAYYTYCKKKKRTVDFESLENSLSDNSNIETRIIDKEEAFDIHRVLHRLNEPYKEIFSLRVFSELSFMQIGQLFGKTESWARVTFFRAKRKIIEELKEEKS